MFSYGDVCSSSLVNKWPMGIRQEALLFLYNVRFECLSTSILHKTENRQLYISGFFFQFALRDLNIFFITYCYNNHSFQVDVLRL